MRGRATCSTPPTSAAWPPAISTAWVVAAVAGEMAARAVPVQWVHDSIAEADDRSWHAAREREPPGLPGRSGVVRVTGAKLVNPEAIAAAVRFPAGEALDANIANENIKRLFARGDFEHAGHTLATDPAGGRVRIADVAEKSWGRISCASGWG